MQEYLRAPENFSKLGARPPSGFLLIGPPGTGNILLAYFSTSCTVGCLASPCREYLRAPETLRLSLRLRFELGGFCCTVLQARCQTTQRCPSSRPPWLRQSPPSLHLNQLQGLLTAYTGIQCMSVPCRCAFVPLRCSKLGARPPSGLLGPPGTYAT